MRVKHSATRWMKRWSPCGRTWRLTVSGPRSCPPHSVSPGHPSSPQTGHRRAASGGYSGGSPGGWRKGTVRPVCAVERAGVFVSTLFHLREPMLILPQAVPPPSCIWLVWRSLSWVVSQHLPTTGTVRAPSKGPQDLGVWTWPWDNPSAFLLKMLGNFKASLSVGIWDHRNTDVYIINKRLNLSKLQDQCTLICREKNPFLLSEH